MIHNNICCHIYHAETAQTRKTWNCYCSTSLIRGSGKPIEKDIDITTPRLRVNHCYSILFLFEIYQISNHKIEAQRFIFIPSKEAPTLLFMATPLGSSTGIGICQQVTDGAKIHIFSKMAKKRVGKIWKGQKICLLVASNKQLYSIQT